MTARGTWDGSFCLRRARLKEEMVAASPFRVLQPLEATGISRAPAPRGATNWAVFDIEGWTPSDAVLARLDELGIATLDHEPQRDDAEAPDAFDDSDAAIEALLDGWWLCVVPDALRSRYSRLLVVQAIVPPTRMDKS